MSQVVLRSPTAGRAGEGEHGDVNLIFSRIGLTCQQGKSSALHGDTGCRAANFIQQMNTSDVCLWVAMTAGDWISGSLWSASDRSQTKRG